MAVSLFNTAESIATPCSVKQNGGWRNPFLSELEVTNCDLQSASSSKVSRPEIGLRICKLKSGQKGKESRMTIVYKSKTSKSSFPEKIKKVNKLLSKAKLIE